MRVAGARRFGWLALWGIAYAIYRLLIWLSDLAMAGAVKVGAIVDVAHEKARP